MGAAKEKRLRPKRKVPRLGSKIEAELKVLKFFEGWPISAKALLYRDFQKIEKTQHLTGGRNKKFPSRILVGLENKIEAKLKVLKFGPSHEGCVIP